MSVGYKVVRLIDGKYYSASLSRLYDPWVVEYAIGTTSTPTEGNGPLTLFDKKSQAENWVDTWVGTGADAASATARERYEIFRCNYERSSSNQLFVDSDKNINRHWTTHASKLPTGTILCDSITPISTVRWE